MERAVNISLAKTEIGIYLFTSIVLTLFLGYIDEGYYSFAWLTEPEAFIFLFLYIGIFFMGQSFSSKVLFKDQKFGFKVLLSFLIGLPLSLITFLLLFTLVRNIVL